MPMCKDPEYAYYSDPDNPDYMYIKIRETGEVCHTTRAMANKIRSVGRKAERQRRYCPTQHQDSHQEQEERRVPGRNGQQQVLEDDQEKIRKAQFYAILDPLSLNCSDQEGKFSNSSWQVDPLCMEEEVEMRMMERCFIDSLPEKQRLVYRLCIQEGYSQKEAASMLNMGSQAVHLKLKKIKNKAKIYLRGD